MKNRINDLFDYNLKIYQDEIGFKFSLDSILLAEFVEAPKNNDLIIDFCTGNAVVPLILSTKFSNKIIGIELQKEIFDLAKKSIRYNKLNNQIEILNDNIKNLKARYISDTFDIVTCNPPYFKNNLKSIKNRNIITTIARHEVEINLEEIILQSKYLLKNQGILYIVHRPERLEEIFDLLNKSRFVVKKLQFVYSNVNNSAIIVLIKAVKNGKYGLKVLKPLDISKLCSYQNMVGD